MEYQMPNGLLFSPINFLYKINNFICIVINKLNNNLQSLLEKNRGTTLVIKRIKFINRYSVIVDFEYKENKYFLISYGNFIDLYKKLQQAEWSSENVILENKEDHYYHAFLRIKNSKSEWVVKD